jgi:hypothetical protein
VTPERKKFNDWERLKKWLGEMYRADVLGVGKRADVFRRAKDTVAADPSLISAANEWIPELEQVCRSRPNAHVEKKQLEYLRELMKEPA